MAFLEIEAKILEINRALVEEQLLARGAEKIFDGELLSVSYTSPNGKRIRIRTFNGKETLLTYKEKTGNAGSFSTEEMEYETEIQDPEIMDYILLASGFICVAKISKRRTSYLLGETRYEIDDYGTIPVFLEFESPSEEVLIAAAAELGFEKEQFFLGGIQALEAHYQLSLNTL